MRSVSTLQSTKSLPSTAAISSSRIQSSSLWHQPHHGAPKCKNTRRCDSFAAFCAAASTSLATSGAAACCLKNASSFLASWPCLPPSLVSNGSVFCCASALPSASSTVRNGMALKSAPRDFARSMCLSNWPTSTCTTSYSYISVRRTVESFFIVPASHLHQPHQLAPHWISTRLFSRLARATAAATSFVASAFSS